MAAPVLVVQVDPGKAFDVDPASVGMERAGEQLAELIIAQAALVPMSGLVLELQPQNARKCLLTHVSEGGVHYDMSAPPPQFFEFIERHLRRFAAPVDSNAETRRIGAVVNGQRLSISASFEHGRRITLSWVTDST